MSVAYQQFIANKRHLLGNFGFDPVWMPECAFDFQEHIISKAVQKGRIGIFADTGLGKTLIQVAIAENIVRHTNKRVLILTPLTVAFQFIDEANRIGVGDIAHTKDGTLSSKIMVCNYERLHLLNPDDFFCVMLDESSILKNFAGKIRDQIVAFIKRVPYRFLSTATPSPNDFIELGNSSEALGYMGYMDMLTKFFRSNQNSVDSNNRNIGEKFYLKPHAI
ncbi:MAG: DEAD/DEAH box helicase family protein [Alphaproteobacteria bacterium]|nr:DEAD/DEAH box helicase family protein [Alphaproteobacteria bacterium]